MKISSLKLNNFKFYTEQYFNTNNKNILLYGENGSGKSSLYWALYVFYKSVYSSSPEKYIKQLDRTQDNNLTNHNANQDASISVTFDNTTNIVIDKNFVSSNSNLSLSSFKAIHFLNHEKLFTLFLKSNTSEFNFYDVMQKEFLNKFDLFNDLESELKNTQLSLQTNQDTLLLNTKLDESLTTLQDLVNHVLITFFEEELEVKFVVDEKFIIESNTYDIWFLANPKIFVLINGYNDFNLRINEARVKLVALLIYLIMIENNNINLQDPSLLKLLVLDDILLSLDMAQRSKILEYIFVNFSSEYQLFIFTHDIFFYDLVKRKIMHVQNQTNFNQTTWEDRLIYTRATPEDYYEAQIINGNDNFLTKAEAQLTNNELDECGNNLRKEMEALFRKMVIKYELGEQGKLHGRINVFRNLTNKNIYNDSHKLLDDLFDKLHDTTINEQQKISEMENLFTGSIAIQLSSLNKLLYNFQWHKDIVGNASSHAQVLQHYRTEFQQAIEDVKKLKSLLNM